MYNFHCNCCGHNFNEEECIKELYDDEVICPNCGAYYDEENELYIERYNN